MAKKTKAHEPEPKGLIGVALKISKKVGQKHGDPRSIKRIKELMKNVREPQKKAFAVGFLDEIGKLAQKAQIAPAPMPELAERRLYQMGTEFQRGQREKQIKMEALKAPLAKASA